VASIIRKATSEDICRIAEILVFNNRINYYPIFNDIQYSFSKFNVIDVVNSYQNDTEFMDNCYIYEDEVILGFICVVNGEIKKLYVDPLFQEKGIGSKLLKFAIEEKQANNVWVLEKNTRARKLYERNGFINPCGRMLEEGTEEYLVHLRR